MRVALLQVEPTGKMKTQHHLCHSIVSQSFGSSISCMPAFVLQHKCRHASTLGLKLRLDQVASTNAGMHLLSVSSCGQIRYLQHAKPSIFMILYGFCQKNKFELKSPIFLVLREREREREKITLVVGFAIKSIAQH